MCATYDTSTSSPVVATAQILGADWAALSLLAFEVPSLLFSQYRANSIGTSEAVAFSVLVYLALRLLMRAPLTTAWLAALVGTGGAWLACVGIHQFALRSRQLTAIGLTDFVAFRSRLIAPVPGWVPGECFTVLLLTLPFACASGVYAWRRGKHGVAVPSLLATVLILAVLVLSLSRAVFWSTIFFFFVVCGLMAAYRVVPIRTASLLMAGSIGAVILILGCETAFYPGIFRAYTGSQISQARSTGGRIDIWKRSMELTRGHRWWGVGSSNSALWLLSSADEDETTGFASRTFSVPVQVLAEKGIVGFACYSAFLLLAGWEFHRGMRLHTTQTFALNSASVGGRGRKPGSGNKEDRARIQRMNAHRAMKCCFAAGLAAVLLRELAYSSLLEHILTLAVTLGLIALMCAPSEPESLKIRPVAIAVICVVLILQVPYLRYARADKKLSEFYKQVASANFTAARQSIDGAIRLWPWNARYYGWRAYVASQELPSQCRRNTLTGTGDLSAKDAKVAREAADDYRHALSLNSRDAVAHQNLAWLEHLLGDDAAAAQDWKEAVDIDPDTPAFHLSYGMFLEERGSVEAAQAQYESAIELEPSTLGSPFFVRYRRRSPGAADFIVKKITSSLAAKLVQSNDPILEAKLGKLYLFTGDLRRAETMLKDAAQQLPNLPLVWLNLGDVYEAQGHDEDGQICYERARAIDPSLAGPFLRIGELNLKADDKSRAEYNLNQAIFRWQRINPVTAAHNNRLYDGPRQTIDDLLPTTLVWYISPCEASAAWTALSRTYPQNARYAQRSRVCEEIPAPHVGAS